MRNIYVFIGPEYPNFNTYIWWWVVSAYFMCCVFGFWIFLNILAICPCFALLFSTPKLGTFAHLQEICEPTLFLHARMHVCVRTWSTKIVCTSIHAYMHISMHVHLYVWMLCVCAYFCWEMIERESTYSAVCGKSWERGISRETRTTRMSGKWLRLHVEFVHFVRTRYIQKSVWVSSKSKWPMHCLCSITWKRVPANLAHHVNTIIHLTRQEPLGDLNLMLLTYPWGR